MKGKIFAVQSAPITESQLSGQGRKAVLVVIAAKEANEKTLQDLLKAINHDPETDVLTLRIDQPVPIDLSYLLASKSVRKLISFGFSPSDLGFHVNEAYYHAYTIGELTAIFSESLQALNTDKAKKLSLWETLQTVFLNKL